MLAAWYIVRSFCEAEMLVYEFTWATTAHVYTLVGYTRVDRKHQTALYLSCYCFFDLAIRDSQSLRLALSINTSIVL